MKAAHGGIGISDPLFISLFMLWIKVATKPATDDSHRILSQEWLPTPIKRE